MSVTTWIVLHAGSICLLIYLQSVIVLYVTCTLDICDYIFTMHEKMASPYNQFLHIVVEVHNTYVLFSNRDS